MGFLGSLDESVPSVHPEAWIAPGALVVGRVPVGRAPSAWYGAVVGAGAGASMGGPEGWAGPGPACPRRPSEPAARPSRLVGHAHSWRRRGAGAARLEPAKLAQSGSTRAAPLGGRS